MNTALLDKKLIDDNVVLRVWKKVDSIAESRGMTRQEFITWSEAEHYRSNISEYEYNLILAYQIGKAIERLKINDKNTLAETTLREHYWINRFKDDFNKVDKAIKHLTEVCGYIRNKYGNTYEYERLLSYDDVLFDKLVEKNKGKGKSRFIIDD